MVALSNEEIIQLLEGCPNDVFYVTPRPILHNGVYIQANRAGIVVRAPENHHITRVRGYRYSVIHCAFSGKGYVMVRDRVYSISMGQGWLLAPQEPHEYWADPEDPWGLAWVEFGGGNSAQMSNYVLDHGSPVFDGSVFHHELELCTSILARSEHFEPKISSIIYEMLISLCTEAEKKNRSNERFQEIYSYIDNHLGKRLTLGSVAAGFGYNPTYFSTLFSRNAGISFSKYIQLQRINQARILLITTQWPLDAIAEEVGYYDMSHFIHAFKAEEGITPSAYRREYRMTV